MGVDYMVGKESWVLDSGASHHITPLYALFDVHSLSTSLRIIVPTWNTMMVDKIGTIRLSSNIKLHNVLHIPEFSCNLIFVHRLTHDLNYLVTYFAHNCDTRLTCEENDWLE
uniref:Retrovirus-related Pol polyprotein from transposon TNT 1-94-like beta-barrel domain-containing protein n=1 Tax=Cajanus cajan TaxID=3821 RepID=A0A151SSD5_CAJCA|nr:hypothetical protein KK1_003965 [Cajanus cajan]